MSTLLLVRHGQASFGAENYDVLSPLGIKQSRLLGGWLARTATHVDAIWTGPLQRQIDTARYLVDAAADEGLQLSEPKILDDFRELPVSQLFKQVLPQLEKHKHPADRQLQSADGIDRVSTTEGAFSSTLELVLDAWANGRVDGGDIESFVNFETRIRRALEHVTDWAAPSQCVAVVTSAGPLSMAMRLALNLDSASMVRLGIATANSGVTELRFRDQRLNLFAFNSVSHLKRDEVTCI